MFRFIVWNTMSLVVLALVEYFFHIFEFVWFGDATHISMAIFGIYVILTACIPFILQQDMREQYEWIERIRFITNRFPYMAIIGTGLGMMILFKIIAANGLNDLNSVFLALMNGMSTVLLTTVFGMFFTMFMDFQLKFEFDITEDTK